MDHRATGEVGLSREMALVEQVLDEGGVLRRVERALALTGSVLEYGDIEVAFSHGRKRVLRRVGARGHHARLPAVARQRVDQEAPAHRSGPAELERAMGDQQEAAALA